MSGTFCAWLCSAHDAKKRLTPDRVSVVLRSGVSLREYWDLSYSVLLGSFCVGGSWFAMTPNATCSIFHSYVLQVPCYGLLREWRCMVKSAAHWHLRSHLPYRISFQQRILTLHWTHPLLKAYQRKPLLASGKINKINKATRCKT